MGYSHAMKLNQDIDVSKFGEICDLVAELAVAWYHDGKHGDAFITEGQLGGERFFSTGDSTGLSQFWKSQEYISLLPEDNTTETLFFAPFPKERYFWCKTWRNDDFCPMVRAAFKGVEKLGYGKTHNDEYYSNTRKGDALLRKVAPYLFNPPLSEEEKTFLKNIKGWEIQTSKNGSIIQISNPSWDWSAKVKDVKSFVDLCEKVCHIVEGFEPSYEVYLRLEDFCPSDRIGDILDRFYELRDKLQVLSTEFSNFLKSES